MLQRNRNPNCAVKKDIPLSFISLKVPPPYECVARVFFAQVALKIAIRPFPHTTVTGQF